MEERNGGIMEMGWAEIGKLLDRTNDGVCGGKQPEFLYSLSREAAPGGEIVEIGTNIGISTVAIAFGQKETGGIPIHSIDIYEHPAIRDNLRNAGVESWVQRHIGASHYVVRSWSRPISLLWIDGDHSRRGVALDIACWVKFVMDGGRVAFHDYPGHNGASRYHLDVYNALKREFIGKPWKWRVVADRVAGSIVVFEKLPRTESAPGPGALLRKRLYWTGRSLRALAIRLFPVASSRYIQRKLGEKYRQKANDAVRDGKTGTDQGAPDVKRGRE